MKSISIIFFLLSVLFTQSYCYLTLCEKTFALNDHNLGLFQDHDNNDAISRTHSHKHQHSNSEHEHEHSHGTEIYEEVNFFHSISQIYLNFSILSAHPVNFKNYFSSYNFILEIFRPPSV